MVPGFLGILKSRSALAELGGAAGGRETVLLALLHSGVAGKEAGGLESGTIGLVYLEEGPATVASISTLPPRPTASRG